MTSAQSGSRWRRTAALLVAALVVSIAATRSEDGKKAPALSDFAWLAGSWTTTQGNVQIDEHWTQPTENTMVGMGRTVRGERTLFFEYLRIEARPEGIFYVAQPKGAPKTDFKLTSYDGTEIVFENPQHDFPKRIRYRREADGSVTARTDAGAGESKEPPQEFRYKRQPR